MDCNPLVYPTAVPFPSLCLSMGPFFLWSGKSFYRIWDHLHTIILIHAFMYPYLTMLSLALCYTLLYSRCRTINIALHTMCLGAVSLYCRNNMCTEFHFYAWIGAGSYSL